MPYVHISDIDLTISGVYSVGSYNLNGLYTPLNATIYLLCRKLVIPLSLSIHLFIFGHGWVPPRVFIQLRHFMSGCSKTICNGIVLIFGIGFGISVHLRNISIWFGFAAILYFQPTNYDIAITLLVLRVARGV